MVSTMASTGSLLPATPEGRAELAAEIACLRTIRRDLIAERDRIGSRSRWPGAPSRYEVAAIDEQIRRLGRILSQTELAESRRRVVLGSRVTVLPDESAVVFRISGPVAADPRLGYVSFESPIGRALLGREVCDEVELIDRRHRRKVRILAAS